MKRNFLRAKILTDKFSSQHFCRLQCTSCCWEDQLIACDVDVAANEFKYPLRKNDENWRYLRQYFALYPSAMEKMHLSVKCQTVRLYLIIGVLRPCSIFQWSWCYIHLKTLWTTDSTALVWRQGSLCPMKLLQGSRGYEKNPILCVTEVNNKGSVSNSFETVLYIPVCRIFYSYGRGWLQDWQMPGVSAHGRMK